jgi:hypothetical protein
MHVGAGAKSGGSRLDLIFHPIALALDAHGLGVIRFSAARCRRSGSSAAWASSRLFRDLSVLRGV